MINPLSGEHGQLGSLLAPFTKPGRKSKSESPARGQRGWKSPQARDSSWNNAGEWGAATLPGKGGLRQQKPEGFGRPGPRSETRARPGGSSDPQLPARPARPKPAYLVCGGSVHGACSRNGPALVGVESASGRFLHGPPLGSRPGSRPPPLSMWPRHRVRLRHWPRRWLQLREEEAAAASRRDHLGRKPRRAQIGESRRRKWRCAKGKEGGGDRGGQWAE